MGQISHFLCISIITGSPTETSPRDSDPGAFIYEPLRPHHWLPVCVTVYKHGEKRRESGKRDGCEKEGLREQQAKRGRRRWELVFSTEGKRYEYSNFTVLIRDGCLFLWGQSAACVCFQPDYLHDVFHSFIFSDGRKMTFWQADNEA